MRRNDKIKVPTAQFIREVKTNKSTFWCFFYNKSEKNEEGEWVISERYVINSLNLQPLPDTEIIIKDIVGVKPQVMHSKDGREFLNCALWCNIQYIDEEPNTSVNSDYSYDNQTTFNVRDNDNVNQNFKTSNNYNDTGIANNYEKHYEQRNNNLNNDFVSDEDLPF